MRGATHRISSSLRCRLGRQSRSHRAVPDLEAQIPVLDGPRIVVVNGVVDVELSSMTGPEGLHLSSLLDARRNNRSASRRTSIAATVRSPTPTWRSTWRSVATVLWSSSTMMSSSTYRFTSWTSECQTRHAMRRARVWSSSWVPAVRRRSSRPALVSAPNSAVRTSAPPSHWATLPRSSTCSSKTCRRATSTSAVSTCTQAADSRFLARSFNLGASYGRAAYDVDLAGPGAHVDLSGLFFGFGDQVLDQQINVVHSAENCTSRQSFRGVLDDESTGIFNGGIEVARVPTAPTLNSRTRT